MKTALFKDKLVIVFDLDGTILKLSVEWISLKNKLSNEYSEIYDESCSFKSVSECLSKVVERNDNNVLESFIDTIRQYEIEKIHETQLIEETVFFINNKELFGVKKDAKLAILSLNTRKAIISSLKLAKIYNKIGIIIGREDVRKWKPNPEGLLKIQNYYNVEKREMIYFGDLRKDILTGNNAGIDAFFISDLISIVNKKRDFK
ncbi:MAG: HAD family hydrolase [Promethearchaeota archaeon]|jgi:HAD superfamily hydrolase (TIGR01549 family)